MNKKIIISSILLLSAWLIPQNKVLAGDPEVTQCGVVYNNGVVSLVSSVLATDLQAACKTGEDVNNTTTRVDEELLIKTYYGYLAGLATLKEARVQCLNSAIRDTTSSVRNSAKKTIASDTKEAKRYKTKLTNLADKIANLKLEY